MKDSVEKKFIAPPLLYAEIYNFIDHYKAAEREPILIIGPTGVGKSVFLHVFKEIFHKDQTDKGEHPIIVEANCSHFGGVLSDPNIARVELFGAVSGAITNVGAKDGLVDKADNGVLVLEEIGELPLEVQAMLLTFIETGKYRKVGSLEELDSKCQIVGATNREEKLRPDFKYRFFPFYVSPIYERRKDILYYIYELDPTLAKTLTRYDILTLLTYNWPGNVREIERVIKLIRRNQMIHSREHDPSSGGRQYITKRLSYLDGRSTAIKALQAQNIYDDLSNRGVKVGFLEPILNYYKTSLNYNRVRYAFRILDELEFRPNDDLDKRFAIKSYPPYPLFESAFKGYEIYCAFFFQSVCKDKNDLEDFTECFYHQLPAEFIKDGKKHESKIRDLTKSIFEYLSGIDLLENIKWPKTSDELYDFFTKLANNHPSNHYLASAIGVKISESKTKSDNIDQIWSWSEEELLKFYYEGVLTRTRGSIAMVTKMFGIPPSTLRDRLKKLGIPRGFRKYQASTKR